ncbi:helix-turn-helix transcriptional regulator [Streptomyces sp. A5-4]|uniref:helix-turn-helix transcriptional regulator n=1 Tax=Streptomyces sp. A5-4 TaxID=3384771 RepID=UPI003DA9F330
MTTRPTLTQREAAACGVSRTTIRRRREAGDLPGALQDPQRGWVIPVDDLLAAGFRLNTPAPPEASAPAAGDVARDQEHGQVEDVAALRAELERARHGRELADAEVTHLKCRLTERGEHIADLQRAIAALMPGCARTR